MGRKEFGPSVIPELREILLSTSEGELYDPDGRVPEVRDMPVPGRMAAQLAGLRPGPRQQQGRLRPRRSGQDSDGDHRC